jgi:hypothetical protein
MQEHMQAMQGNMKRVSGMGDPHSGLYPGMMGGSNGPMPE